MSGSNGASRRFRIDAAAAVVQKAGRLYQVAGETGRASAFAAAMRELRSQLRARPRECGEPLRIYRNARFELRVASVRPAVIWYVVHQVEYEVTVPEVELMGPR